LGGAGSQDDILKIIQKFKIIGATAGSLFVFKGPYKAVLISYLDVDIREKIRQISHKRG
jgi:cyclase